MSTADGTADEASYPAARAAQQLGPDRVVAPRRTAPEQLALLLPPPPPGRLPPPAQLRQAPMEPQVPVDWRARAQARLDGLWHVARQHLGRRRMACPGMTYFRGHLHAGRACFAGQLIEINEDLLERYPTAMLGETIAHELAHLLVYRVYGRKARSHGAEWQRVMREWFNVEPERTHHFDMTGIAVRRQQRHRYGCTCQVHELSTVRHKRARRGVEYRCVRCTAPLQFLGPSEAGRQ